MSPQFLPQFVPPFLLLILLSSACPFSLAFSSDILPSVTNSTGTGNGTDATTDPTDTTGNSDLMTNATLPEETTAKEEEGTKPGTDGTAGDGQGTAEPQKDGEGMKQDTGVAAADGNGTAEPPKEGDESPQESFACSVLCWTLIIVGGVFICAVGLTAFVLLTVHYQNARADPNNPSASAVQMSAIPRGMTAH
ncbi:hypothetical protein niasHS_003846 [Heterodera schachtii]|uniref:Uncharacterized protein n=2 Tax=Heterodera TaxID=34509 RepID=A0ABD2K3E6_HETSC